MIKLGRHVLVFCLYFPSSCLAWEHLVFDLCPFRGVPAELAIAVIQVESSGKPYALGVTIRQVHRGYFPDDYETASYLLDSALSYTSNVGIGLMQITWSVWGKKLDVEPHLLLDPEINIRLGCTLLGSLLSESGSLIERIGRYHSFTPRLRDAYGKKVLSLLRNSSFAQRDLAMR